MNRYPPQNPYPNQNPDQLLYHPTMPNQLNQPMTKQLNQFYNQSNATIPAPSNLGQITAPYENFNTAFNPARSIPFNGHQPKAMFNNHGFVNRGDLLHNDLYDNILHEEIREYSILIDSKDRDFSVYPNPFCYKVTFNPLPTTKINGRVIHETPNPVIHENLCNVRYIALEEAILPFYTRIKCNKDDSQLNLSKSLTDYLYIVLDIKEYCNINHRSTNDTLSDSFATIYYDETVNATHYMGRTRGGIKVFQPDQLGIINSFDINFKNPYGEILNVNHFDDAIGSVDACNCDEEIGYIADNCFQHNLYHPLFPAFQHHLHFRVGVVEARLNKQTFS